MLRSSKIKIVPEICIDNKDKKITAAQVAAIFGVLAETRSATLKVLECFNTDNTAVPPTVLVRVLSRLESVALYSRFHTTHLTTDQLTSLYRIMAEDGALRLKELKTYWNDHSAVASDIIVAALSRLERLEMIEVDLTPSQLTDIYQVMAEGGYSSLRVLIMRRNDHSAVPSDLLLPAIKVLESVELYGAYLTTEQLTGIYEMVAERRTGNLKEITIHDGNDHSVVPESIRRRAELNKGVQIK